MKEIEALVEKLSIDPFNPEINFQCALEYEKLNQTASAVSFFLRSAEYGYESHKAIAYTSLLKMSFCFEDQNDRVSTVSNCILQALALMPDRPEAYFHMSRFYEKNKSWQECYTWAELGMNKHANFELPAFVNYYDKYCLEFQKGISAWWIGRKNESIDIMLKLSKQLIAKEYSDAVANNIQRLKIVSA